MINHFTTRRLGVFVIAMAMALGVLLPSTVNAQSDSFFSSGEQNSRDGISLGGCSIENPGQGGFGFGNSQQENNLPLDSGLLIMVMAGVYVLLRRKHLKRLSILIIAVVLMLELSQCKKDNVEPIAAGEGVFITLDCGYNGGRTSFDPSTCSFVWSNPTEYINVGGSESGYLGQITGEGDGVSQTIRFSGTIATPVNGETLYFMYLGNGDHAGATVLDFSNQDGTLDGVTDYHVAVGSAVYDGQTSFTATLEMRVAFARIDMSDPQVETCKGLFSVDGTKVGTNTVIKKMVRFSPGNLQYNDNESVKWRFAEHQWDYVGKWNTNSWVDLFGWGTWSGTREQWNPLNISDDYEEYQWHGDATFQYELAGHDDWYTPSKDEFVWLIGHYTSNPGSQCREGNRFLNAIITVGNKNYDGIIIFPDGYTGGIGNYAYNNYDGERTKVSAADWSLMEAAGAVFLPVAGKRVVSSVSGVGNYGSLDYLGYCWSYTPDGYDWAYYVDFRADAFVGHSVNPRGATYRFYGQSVRLVR